MATTSASAVLRPVLIVEGDADLRFLTCYVEEAYQTQLTEHDFIRLRNDWRGLEKYHAHMRRRLDEGRPLLAVLDADWDEARFEPGGFRKRIQAVRSWFESHGLPVSVFLWPNNAEDGTLETMLESITPPHHRAVFRCFEKYEECLRASDPSYVTPGQKARIYAYVEALGVRGDDRKDANRNYRDTRLWDLTSSYLHPLREFLSARKPAG